MLTQNLFLGKSAGLATTNNINVAPVEFHEYVEGKTVPCRGAVGVGHDVAPFPP